MSQYVKLRVAISLQDVREHYSVDEIDGRQYESEVPAYFVEKVFAFSCDDNNTRVLWRDLKKRRYMTSTCSAVMLVFVIVCYC